MKVAMVVEGHGDVEAYPRLVARVGSVVGRSIFAPRPIRARPAVGLARPGELERYATMAASRADADLILVAVDLDDGCAAEFHKNFLERCAPIVERYGKNIRICFSIREFECWFLSDIEELRAACPEYGWYTDFICGEPESIRGAKEELQRGMARHYKEVIDQPILTGKLNLTNLFRNSRSFRKFSRALTGLTYDELSNFFAR